MVDDDGPVAVARLLIQGVSAGGRARLLGGHGPTPGQHQHNFRTGGLHGTCVVAVRILYGIVQCLYCAVFVLYCRVFVLYCTVFVLYCTVFVLYCTVFVLYCTVCVLFSAAEYVLHSTISAFTV